MNTGNSSFQDKESKESFILYDSAWPKSKKRNVFAVLPIEKFLQNSHQKGTCDSLPIVQPRSLAERYLNEELTQTIVQKTFISKRIFTGRTALLFSVILVSFLLTPIIFIEARYQYDKIFNPPKKIRQAVIKNNAFGELLWLQEKGITEPVDFNFGLVIPKAGINASVEASVDISQTKEYEEALKKGVAHAKGTSLPNTTGSIYIFGHSTNFTWNIKRYNAFFYALKYLNPGDEIYVFYKGKHYDYQVSDKKVIEANDLQFLEPDFSKKQLVLQTCWPPGTTWKRLIVVAEPTTQSISAL